MNGLKEWWNQNTPRDQMAMFFLALAAGTYILYALVQASHGKYTAQLEANKRGAASLTQVRELSAQVIAQNNPGGSQGADDILGNINESLRTYNLKISSMQPQSNGAVRLRLEQIRYNDLMAWLHEMEVAQGLKIKESSITTAAEKGMVSATVALSK